MGKGEPAVLVANYGGPFKLFDMQEDRTIKDMGVYFLYLKRNFKPNLPR